MIYKILFWVLVVAIFLYWLYKKQYSIEWCFQIFMVYVYHRPMFLYMERYVAKHGWKRYQYKSLRPEDNGKRFEHPDMWVHPEWHNTRYGTEGEYGLYTAYMISKGKGDKLNY